MPYNQLGYTQYPYNSYQAYQPGYAQPYQTVMQNLQQSQQQQMNQQLQNTQQLQSGQATPQPQIQSGGFISVRSIEEAFNYPVAPGNSVTFKDENAPYVYTKTKGFSQLEEPVFEKYRLVKEENGQPIQAQQAQEPTREEKSRGEYALKSDLLETISDLDDLRKEIDRLKKQLKNTQKQPKKENVTVSKNEISTQEQEEES